MKDPNLILLVWKKERREFSKNLAILKQHSDKKAVHDIRVAVKKLSAYLKLYILLKEAPEQEYILDKTEKLFDILGKQRDIEICLTLIKNYEKESHCRITELKQYLKRMLKNTQPWTSQSIREYHKKEISKIELLLKKDGSLADKDVLIKQIQAIINNHLSAIKASFKQPHRVRKCLKEVYYWIEIITDESLKNIYDQQELHLVLDDLGEWQDNEILLAKTKHFRKDYLPKPFKETAVLKTLEASTKEKKESLRKTAISRTKTWLKKIAEP